MTDQAEALAQGAAIRTLDDHVVLAFSGEDARSWLGGQVTSHVAAMKPGEALYALFTNAKGKILADAFVLCEGDEQLYAVVPASAHRTLLESFDKYIVMEDVTPAVRDDLRVVTVQGPEAGAVVGAVPDLATFACDRLGTGGRDVLVPAERASAVEAALIAAGARPIDQAAWESLRVRLGVPRFGADFDETRYPQEAGLTRRAVSFTKGCYLGQEVVCMLESRGKVSRRLAQLTLDADPPPAGAPVTVEGAEVGRVTSAAPADGEAGAVLLAMLKAAVAEPGRRVQIDGREARVTRIVD